MNPAIFLDPYAAAIVGGGTLAAAVLRAPFADQGRALRALLTLPRRDFSAGPLLDQVHALSRLARRQGPIALDRPVIADPDLAAAVAMIVDGEGGDAVAAEMRHRRRARIERHAAAAEVWSGMAEAAPAMGMVGTLIGLVTMFTRMNDPRTIGQAMAIALLATLYGAILANLILQPIASRLRAAARSEAFERARLEAPVALLAERSAPGPSRRGERGLTDDFPPARRPLWLVTLADLSLLLSASSCCSRPHVDRARWRRGCAGLHRGRPPPRSAHALAAGDGFAPGSAALPGPPDALIAWAREAARDPRITLTVTGGTDGSAADVDPASGSAIVLAADRAAVVAAVLSPVAPGRILASTTNRPGPRRAIVTLAFAGEGNVR
ncbi:MAG: MotA/TolQ/ExbB proton channel family protein [Sphingomonas bacterium]